MSENEGMEQVVDSVGEVGEIVTENSGFGFRDAAFLGLGIIAGGMLARYVVTPLIAKYREKKLKEVEIVTIHTDDILDEQPLEPDIDE